MWPFVPHAVFLTVSNSLEHAVTAPFCYFIQNLKNNILITDSFVKNCHSKESKNFTSEKTEGEPDFYKNESAGEQMIKSLYLMSAQFCLFVWKKPQAKTEIYRIRW